jgi:hypothetical protein
VRPKHSPARDEDSQLVLGDPRELFERGANRPVPDRSCKMEEAPAAGLDVESSGKVGGGALVMDGGELL